MRARNQGRDKEIWFITNKIIRQSIITSQQPVDNTISATLIAMADKTSYAQSLMHMIKGNLGTGILAMPASFAHLGLVNAVVGLPFLCIISTYCVHLLVQSSQQLESKTKGLSLQYAGLAKHSFKSGPKWMRASSGLMCRLVDGTLLVAQLGVCCVYVVFVVENIISVSCLH